jgi:hypothetical protein
MATLQYSSHTATDNPLFTPNNTSITIPKTLKQIRDEKRGQRIDKMRVYATAVNTGATKTQALKLAGFAPSSRGARVERTRAGRAAIASIDSQRAVLQAQAGFRFSDSLQFYRKKRDSKRINPETQIKAATRIDDLLGFAAPKELHVTERREIAIALGGILEIAHTLQCSPADLVKAIKPIQSVRLPVRQQDAGAISACDSEDGARTAGGQVSDGEG